MQSISRASRLVNAPSDAVAVSLRQAGGHISRARIVQVFVEGAGCINVSKAEVRRLLKRMKGKGKKTITLCDPFGDGVLVVG